MIARVATFNPLPDSLDDDAVELLRRTIRSVPGYIAGFHMLDPKTRKALSVCVFEDRDAAERTRAALDERPEGRRVGITADTVEFYEAIPF
jgi:hypothetical protein